MSAVCCLGTPTGTAAAASEPSSALAAWHAPAMGGDALPGPPARLAHLPNMARAVPSWWSGADPDIDLAAATARSFLGRGAGGGNILNAAPREPVYLYPYAATGPLRLDVREACLVGGGPTCPIVWQVDSPDARVRPYRGTGNVLTEPVQSAAGPVGVFVASRPGVYTVRAVWFGHDSEPLVLAVGLGRLHAAVPAWFAHALAVTSGVVAERASVLAGDPHQSSALTAGAVGYVGQPVDGWLPIWGRVPRGILQRDSSAAVQAILSFDGTPAIWGYALPVAASGTFADVVRLPEGGPFEVTLAQDTLGPHAHTWSGTTFADMLVVAGQAGAASSRRLQTLSTFFVDQNLPLDAPYVRDALAIWQNSPSAQIAMSGISNLVAERVRYHFADDLPGRAPYESGAATLSSGVAVCNAYAKALAGLYRALGIRSVVVMGVTRFYPGTEWTSFAVDGHAWVEAKVPGAGWEPFDPTWDSAERAPLDWLTNAFEGSSQLFVLDHRPSLNMFGAASELGG